MKRVAIIGGGLAGLTCAYTLKRRGTETVVFEALPVPGGRAVTDHHNGVAIDFGAQYLLGPDLFKNTFKLIDEIGLSTDVLQIAPQAAQAYKGSIYHHKVASVAGLLAFKGLHIVDKALLPRMAYLLATYHSLLDFHHPERGTELDDETVASFIKRELSQNILNYIAGPLISTLFYYGSEETSKLLYLVLAKHMYSTRMSTIRGGAGRIASRLADQIPVVFNHPVTRVSTAGEAYRIEGENFSDMVFATPGDAVLKIEGVDALLSPEDREFFRECRYERVLTLAVATDRPVDGDCYGVSIPRVEHLAASTISFHDYIDRSRIPAGRGLLTIAGGGDISVEHLLEDLEKLYAIQSQWMKSREWASGMPKFPPGRYRQIAAFRQRLRRPGLFFCGDYLMGPFIEGAVTTGLEAAEAIAEDPL